MYLAPDTPFSILNIDVAIWLPFFKGTMRPSIMKRTIPCPPSFPDRCDFIELAPMIKGEEGTVMNVMQQAFPYMKIDEWWKGKLKDGGTIVARKNGNKIIGVANVTRGDVALLNLLAIAPEYQGLGMGSTLLAEAEDVARDEGARSMHLMTEQIKTQNVSFYSNHGYVVTGINKNGYDHCPGVLFHKMLSHP